MKTLDFEWNAEHEKNVNKILGNAPEPDMNWRDWAPFESRRSQAVRK